MSYASDRESSADPSITSHTIYADILDIITKTSKDAATIANGPGDTEVLPAMPDELPAGIDNDILATSWLDELSDFMHQKTTSSTVSNLDRQGPQMAPHGVENDDASDLSSLRPLDDVQILKGEQSNQTDTLNPRLFFDAAFSDYHYEDIWNIHDSKSSEDENVLLAELQRYLSFTMPSCPSLCIHPMDELLASSLIDFSIIANRKEKETMIKSIFIYVICFHALLFRPIPSDLTSALFPLMESIKKRNNSSESSSSQYTFPVQFFYLFNTELMHASSSTSSNFLAPNLKIFISPLISVLFQKKLSNVDDNKLKPKRPLKSCGNTVFLEHSDRHEILDTTVVPEFTSSIKKLCKENPHLSHPEYEFNASNPSTFTVSCKWLGTTFKGEDAKKMQAQENASKAALDYYYLNHHQSKTVQNDDELACLKNPDSMSIDPKDNDATDNTEPSFSPLRNSHQPASLPNLDLSSIVPASLNSEDLLLYSQYFWNLYQQSTAFSKPKFPAHQNGISSLNGTPHKINEHHRLPPNFSLKELENFLPFILPPLNGNRKYVSLIMEYCQIYKMPPPEFVISNHVAPFVGRCQWLDKTFYSGALDNNNNNRRESMHHQKKSDAKEELAKNMISYLLSSDKLGESVLIHLKVPELIPFLNKEYVYTRYLQDRRSRHQDNHRNLDIVSSRDKPRHNSEGRYRNRIDTGPQKRQAHYHMNRTDRPNANSQYRGLTRLKNEPRSYNYTNHKERR